MARILIIMDPGILVPPNGYGGHERLVEMFAKEYLEIGHEVDLLVTEGSKVAGCQIYSSGKEGLPQTRRQSASAIVNAWFFLFKSRRKYDLIHNFGRLAYLLPILNLSVKKIMTYGREIDSKNIRVINVLPNKNIVFTGCSSNLISRVNAGGKWYTVYNAIPFTKYSPNFKIEDDAPLVFLGRLEKVKGVHIAIKVAIESNSRLIIAGNVSDLPEEKIYFEEKIFPLIDNNNIKYIGSVNDNEKNELLRNSKALLFPIEWNEPFGMVMVEAMACGTPVIGFNKGSVSEVIDEGVTGFKVENADEMINQLKYIKEIDRKLCYETARKRFDVNVVAQNYLSLFNE